MPREFKTILCPTDFSADSVHALEYASRFAQLSNGTILLSHVIHVPAGELFTGDHTLNFREAEERAYSLLEELKAKHVTSGVSCEISVGIGDPAQMILNQANERNADLLITATHGHSGFKHLIMGSTAEKVIRHAPCPVLVVRKGVD